MCTSASKIPQETGWGCKEDPNLIDKRSCFKNGMEIMCRPLVPIPNLNIKNRSEMLTSLVMSQRPRAISYNSSENNA